MRPLSLLFIFLLGCNPTGQEPPQASLIRVDAEVAGTNCETGGVSIRAGLDTDRNGALSLNEVQSIHYVCNGGAAQTAELMKQAAEDAVSRARENYLTINESDKAFLNWEGTGAPEKEVSDPEKGASEPEKDASEPEKDPNHDSSYEGLMRRAQEALIRADIDQVMTLAFSAHQIKKDPDSALLLAIAACHKRDLKKVLKLKRLLTPQLFRKLKKACQAVGFPIRERSTNPCLKNPKLPQCEGAAPAAVP